MAKKKSNYIMVVLLSIAFLGVIVAAIFAPKEIDWSKSFSRKHITPLGNRLVFDLLSDLFPQQKITTAHLPLAEFLGDTVPFNTNFIYVNTEYFPDAIEMDKLIDVIEAGNNVFVAAEKFSSEFTGQTGVWLSVHPPLDPSLTVDSMKFSFTNRKLDSATGYWFKKAVSNNLFYAYDSTRTTVLGYDGNGKTNFIRMKFGEGFLYVHCNPMVFTNYHLLAGNHSEYIFKCLSYLPVASTVWDENYKVGNHTGKSSISYILNNRALRVAWYIMLLGIVLFFVFNGKRRQRPIPVIPLPQNNSLEFVETVSRLYFTRHDHRGIAQKRFVYFMDFLRRSYFIDMNVDEERLIEEVSQKSGIERRSVSSLFDMAKNLEKINHISQEDLLQFNRQLEYFYKNCR